MQQGGEGEKRHRGWGPPGNECFTDSCMNEKNIAKKAENDVWNILIVMILPDRTTTSLSHFFEF
jgi:hypothetical protein